MRRVYIRNPIASFTYMGSSPLARGLRPRFQGGRRRPGIIPARAGFTPSTRRQSHSTSGSSPLARGLHRGHRLLGQRNGIIPARAGFTRRCAGRMCPGPDHPRSRGVYAARGASEIGYVGSSPLARGLPVRSWRSWRSPGIIPARAGFTPTTPLRNRWKADHPRSRGVYYAVSWTGAPFAGSSPLVRGLLDQGESDHVGGRIIPARAGFTYRPVCRHCR